MYDRNEGVLTIQTRVVNRMIQIKIIDTGVGIEPDQMDKIFDPFYTTKPLTAEDNRPTGTGLGLASCQEMIASYGGRIKVESKFGKGATFTVELPVSG